MGTATTSLYFGGLSFGIAALSFVVNRVTGEWPSEAGMGGVAVFAFMGVAMVGYYLATRSDAGATTTSRRDAS